jgi:hypothetical protein
MTLAMNFLKIASGIDPVPLLFAIKNQPALWGRSFRTSFANSPHREVLDCLLRVQVPEKSEDPRETFWTPAWACLPQARPLVYGLFSRVEGERLGRTMLTWMVPGTTIYRHRDIGPKEDGFYDGEPYWSRLHVVLEGNERCTFTCGEDGQEETVVMAVGEAWWFNAALLHQCHNGGTSDRVHLILDVHTAQFGA